MADEEQKKEVTFNPQAFDPDNYVLISHFMQPFDAQMAKGVLESASIEYFLYGENANNLLAPAFHSGLAVHRRDEETARKLLEPEPETGEEETTDGK